MPSQRDIDIAFLSVASNPDKVPPERKKRRLQTYLDLNYRPSPKTVSELFRRSNPVIIEFLLEKDITPKQETLDVLFLNTNKRDPLLLAKTFVEHNFEPHPYQSDSPAVIRTLLSNDVRPRPSRLIDFFYEAIDRKNLDVVKTFVQFKILPEKEEMKILLKLLRTEAKGDQRFFNRPLMTLLRPFR